MYCLEETIYTSLAQFTTEVTHRIGEIVVSYHNK